jgi:FixJ family two-component response regulator
MREPTATIYVVDDDVDVCRALGRLLRSAYYDVRLFTSAVEFLELHDPLLHGCIVLDFAMPAMSGLEVQAALSRSGCRRPLIFLSAHGSIATSVDAMRAGAVTFLTKPIERRQLFGSIEEALRIDVALRRETSLQDAMLARLATLTPRERQVLSHVVSGRLNKQIAADLGTTEKTIKVHRARVMQKMSARSLAQLVRIAAVVGITSESMEDGVECFDSIQMPVAHLDVIGADYKSARTKRSNLVSTEPPHRPTAT